MKPSIDEKLSQLKTALGCLERSTETISDDTPDSEKIDAATFVVSMQQSLVEVMGILLAKPIEEQDVAVVEDADGPKSEVVAKFPPLTLVTE